MNEKNKKILDEALELLTQHNQKNGSDWSQARLLAYAAMYGMMSNNVSTKKAKSFLEIAREW